MRAATPRAKVTGAPLGERPPARGRTERQVDNAGVTTELTYSDGHLVAKRTIPPRGARAMPDDVQIRRANGARSANVRAHRGR